MPAADHQRALARRRTPGLPRYGADVSFRGEDRVDDLIRVTTRPAPWAARKQGSDRTFRARLLPGTVVLPARPSPPDRRALSAVLASRPVVVRSLGVSRPIPAYVPWVVPSDTEWRIAVSEPTDLRLVHSLDVPPGLVDGAVSYDRPSRFLGRAGTIVGTAVKAATPVWIDGTQRPVPDLAATPRPDWLLVHAYERDTVDAFALMMTWALEQHSNHEDPRYLAVAGLIRSRLADPGLSTHGISEQLGISRRTLQRLFSSDGGVAGYIRRLRLNTVLQMLTREGHQAPDLDELAAATGLGSRRTLERAMRQVYGLTPGQARSHLLAGHPLRDRSDDDLAG